MSKTSKSLVPVFLFFFFFAFGSIGDAQEEKMAYTMPRTSPLYSPPPIQFRDNRILTIVFQTSPETLKKIVPDPLIPNPLNLMFVYVSRLNIEIPGAERFPYLEIGIGVPTTFSKTMGNYAVYLYLDKALPIVGGREVWGWPKKDASISFIEKEGKISASLERLGFPLMSVNASLEKKIEPIPESPSMPWYNLKIIPSVEKDAPPEICQLTSTVNKDSEIREYYDCEAELEFRSSPYDNLAEIEVLKITAVTFQVTDFVMDFGKIIHDYLAVKKTGYNQ